MECEHLAVSCVGGLGEGRCLYYSYLFLLKRFPFGAKIHYITVVQCSTTIDCSMHQSIVDDKQVIKKLLAYIMSKPLLK